jgi:FdhE protein
MIDLREPWRDLLARRSAMAPSLAPYGELLEAWSTAAPPPQSSPWSAERCRAIWARGVPLAADIPPSLESDDVEDLLGAAMEAVAATDTSRGAALQRLAGAWDARAITAESLLPRREGIGNGQVEAASGLDAATATFLAYATLRPLLEPWLAPARAHFTDGAWGRGVCPFCGAPPGFVDVVEGGHRRLACHVCGGAWGFAKLRCPLCGVEGTKDLHRLQAEGSDAGYVIVGCRACRAYLKELDRRERWNGGPPLLEDWGSPHLDVIARREGFVKPVPALLDLARIPINASGMW